MRRDSDETMQPLTPWQEPRVPEPPSDRPSGWVHPSEAPPDDRAAASGMAEHAWWDRAAVLLCLAWMIVALSLGLSRLVGNWGVETDFFARDVPEAKSLLAGSSYQNLHYPPGYVYLLLAVAQLTHDFFAAGIIISAVSSALLGLVTYGILSSLFDRRSALLATIMTLLALTPHAVTASTDMVANLWLLIPFWLAFRRPPTLYACVVAGAAAGVAYLLRYNAIFVLAGIPLAWCCWSPRETSWPRRLALAATFLAGATLMASPWLVSNWQRHGNPFASDLYLQVAAHFFHPRGDAFPENFSDMQDDTGSISDVLTRDPLAMLRTFLVDVAHDRIFALSLGVVPFPAFLMLGVGTLLYLRELNRRRAAFLMVCLMGYLLHGLAGYTERFFLFLFPLLFMWVVLAVREVDRVPIAFEGRRWRWGLGVPVVVLLLCGSLYDAVAQGRLIFQTAPIELLDVAAVLKEHAEADDGLLVVEPHLAYLSGLRRIQGQVGDRIEQYLSVLEKDRGRFVLYSRHDEIYWPGLKVFRDPELLPPQFVVIYRHPPSETILYEIRRPADSP